MKFSTQAAIAAGIFILIAVALTRGGNPSGSAPDGSNGNVSVVDGQQIVTIRAKGGYLPGTTDVKAGIPTILRVITSATYDCSSAIRIPSLRIGKNLPPSGTTDIALGTLQPGILQGTCGMGMYRFELNAQ